MRALKNFEALTLIIYIFILLSYKMFTQTASTLEKDGLLKRKIYQVVPHKVEYSLTPLGESAIPFIMQMGFWDESL